MLNDNNWDNIGVYIYIYIEALFILLRVQNLGLL